MTNTNPLVSIAVITYNSSRYVLETLESAKQQTYQNIELIISDDCSTDNTVDICKDWLEKNKERFVHSKIITVDHNTGISVNGNRAIKACKGEWVKSIAGDDILLPNCVSIFINYVVFINKEAKVVFSQIQKFHENNTGKVDDGIYLIERDVKSFFLHPANEQFEMLLNWDVVPTPSAFFLRDIFIKYPYNEIYKYREDYPQWLKLTYNGIELYYVEKITVLYRISNSSSVRNYNGQYYSPKSYSTNLLFFWNEKIKYLGDNHAIRYSIDRQQMLIDELVAGILGNRKSRIHNIIYWVIKVCVHRLTKFKVDL